MSLRTAFIAMIFLCGCTPVRPMQGVGKSVAVAVKDGTGAAIVVHDGWQALTRRFAVDGTVEGAPALSERGAVIAFATTSALDATDGNSMSDVYLLSTDTGDIFWLTAGLRDPSKQPFISVDGRFVTFTSGPDVLLADRSTGRIEHVCTKTPCTLLGVSADARYVSYQTQTGIMLRDMLHGSEKLLPSPKN